MTTQATGLNYYMTRGLCGEFLIRRSCGRCIRVFRSLREGVRWLANNGSCSVVK